MKFLLKYTGHYTLLFSILFLPSILSAQTSFQVYLEPFTINGLGGVQSFAYGQADGKWLIIGGRLDGLHRRQPFASFDANGNNNQLLVIDPVNLQKWSATLSSLPQAIQEQLSSTNMEFHQTGNQLYLVGGYGYSNTVADHVTYSNLTAVDVPNTINAIINGTSFTSYFRQITNNNFALTGGHLSVINNTYYLVGGQKFMGRYNPMGPSHGPGFIQEYSNQVRHFEIEDDGVNLSISNYQAVTDTLAFHRRDYNVVQQILPSQEEGITAFSGVFQPTVDVPYLNSVTLDSTSYIIDNSFAQYYNHYHCAVLPMYSVSSNEMHNVFFGGIAQYYDSLGVLVQDNNVPFVKTIARVTRNSVGNLEEYKMSAEMPSLLGAGSEFIPLENLPHYHNEVIKFDSLGTDTTLVGYIYGGIASSAPNIFFINTGTESSASNQLFKVYVVKQTNTGVSGLNPQSTNGFQFQVYPNPNRGIFTIRFYLQEMSSVQLTIGDINGVNIIDEQLSELAVGENIIEINLGKSSLNGIFWVGLKDKNKQAVQKIILSD